MNKAILYRRVDELREKFSLCGEFDPFELAEKLGIKVSFYDFDSRRLGGVLLRDEKHAEIIISASRCEESRRFIASHELIHYFFHDSETFFCCESESVDLIEWQANEGAAELLMPYRKFLLFYQNIRSQYLTEPEKAISRMAKEFSVTVAMIKNRFASLDGEISLLESGVPIDKITVLSKKSLPCINKRSIDVEFDE